MFDPDDDTLEFVLAEEQGNRFLAGHAVPVHVQFGAVSDRGKARLVNEDHFAIVERRRSRHVLHSNLPAEYLELPDDAAYVMIVADGMGGAACGDLASRLAIRTVWELTTRVTKWVMRMNDEEPPEVRERVHAFAQMVNRALRQRSRADTQLAGMGTTLTATYTMGPDAVIAHIGDTRAYLFRGGQLIQLTKDHTLAQEMVDAGASADEVLGYRHVLTNCLGGGNDQVSVDVSFLTLQDQDGLLVCSDGLNLHVSDEEIRDCVASNDVPQAACDALLQKALERGGKDNITVLLARYTILDAKSESEETTASFQ